MKAFIYFDIGLKASPIICSTSGKLHWAGHATFLAVYLQDTKLSPIWRQPQNINRPLFLVKTTIIDSTGHKFAT